MTTQPADVPASDAEPTIPGTDCTPVPSIEVTDRHRIDPPEDAAMIQEYRLRRWARKHYVPRSERHEATWHPIILDEMRKRDAELDDAGQQAARIVQRYVPLAPAIEFVNQER